MIMRNILCLLLAGLLASCADSDDGDAATPAANVIFKNARVYTVDARRSWASAVAVQGANIVYVGSDAGTAAYEGPDTRVVDLGGKMLMPSFQDAHIHPITAGRDALTVDLSGLRSIEEYVAAIKAYADANPDAEWILGGGWTMDVFGPGARASKRLIDAVVADRPVYMASADGHTGWANSKALQMAGIDADTPDPPSGIVDRDPDSGEIIGSLQEGAMDLLEAHVPAPTPEFDRQSLQYSVDLLNSYGITAINDASVYPADLETYRALDKRGSLSLRVVASLWWDRYSGLEQIEVLKQQRDTYTQGRINANSVKIMQDGVMENYTAAMSEPYFVEGNPSGISMLEPDFLKTVASRLHAEGFQLHFHAIGDAAISQCLDAVEAALDAHGDTQRRHHISHLQAIHPEDLPRFRELGVIANFQPLWAYADSYITDLTLPFIGAERGNWMYTIRSVVNAGGMIAFGSDWAVSTANPLPQIETAVTRADAELGGTAFLPQETIELPTAIAAFTINAAYVNGLDDITGSIEVGKQADLIVLDRNLFDVAPAEISDIEVLLTMLAGEVVYERR